MASLPNPVATDVEPDRVEMMNYAKHKLKLARLQSKGLLNTYYHQTTSRAKKIDILKIMQGGDMYTPETFLDGVDKYFKEIEARETVSMVASGETLRRRGTHPYTIEGLCAWMGISMHRFAEYEHSEKYADFNEIARFAKTVIVDKLVNGAMIGDFNNSFTQFYLMNNTKMSKDGETANEHKRRVRPTKVIYVTCQNRKEVDSEKNITAEVKVLDA